MIRTHQLTSGNTVWEASMTVSTYAPDTISAGDMWLFTDIAASESVQRGLAQLRLGLTQSHGSFAEFADDKSE
jgi:hypothetical protein